MSKLPEISEENFEEKYEKFKDFGNQVYKEYEELYKLQSSKLIAAHLDPFAKILLEHEKIALNNKDELMESVRNSIEKQMQKALSNLWQAKDVSNALISLEVLKETFQPYEGHKWNLNTKTPWEITRPVRMRFKEKRLRYLEAQLNVQNKHLNEILEETENLRLSLRDVIQRRNFLVKSIEESREKIKLGTAKLIDLQQRILSTNEENIEKENKKM